MGMTQTMNLLANGSTAKLVHLTLAEISTRGQRQYAGICGRKVTGYVLLNDGKIPVTCPKCIRMAN